MNVINRAALTTLPKQPYIDWANSLDEEWPKLDPRRPEWEYTVYLIGNVRDDADVRAALKKHYPRIFEHELASWHLNKTAWPKNRTFETFKAWFEVRLSSMVIDLQSTRIQTEEFEF